MTAVAPIRPLAWELSYAAAVALKRKKKKKGCPTCSPKKTPPASKRNQHLSSSVSFGKTASPSTRFSFWSHPAQPPGPLELCFSQYGLRTNCCRNTWAAWEKRWFPGLSLKVNGDQKAASPYISGSRKEGSSWLLTLTLALPQGYGRSCLTW